jgi:hypothetical protein
MSALVTDSLRRNDGPILILQGVQSSRPNATTGCKPRYDNTVNIGCAKSFVQIGSKETAWPALYYNGFALNRRNPFVNLFKTGAHLQYVQRWQLLAEYAGLII